MNDSSKPNRESSASNFSKNVYQYNPVFGDKFTPKVNAPVPSHMYSRPQSPLQLQQFQYQFQYPQFQNQFSSHNYPSQQVSLGSSLYCSTMNPAPMPNVSPSYHLLNTNNMFGVIPSNYYMDPNQDRVMNVTYSPLDNATNNYYSYSPYYTWNQNSPLMSLHPSAVFQESNSNISRLPQSYLNSTYPKLLYDKLVHTRSNINSLDTNADPAYLKKHLKLSSTYNKDYSSGLASSTNDSSGRKQSQSVKFISVVPSQTSPHNSEKQSVLKRRKTHEDLTDPNKHNVKKESSLKKKKLSQNTKENKKPPKSFNGDSVNKKKTLKKNKDAVKEHNFNISLPPPPKEVLDDLDVAMTDLKYYRSPLPLNEGIEVYKCPLILKVAYFIEVVSDWIFLPHNKHLVPDPELILFPLVLEKLVGFNTNVNNSYLHLDILMSALLRFFCRRFERLRPNEVATSLFLTQYQVRKLTDYLLSRDIDNKNSFVEINGVLFYEYLLNSLFQKKKKDREIESSNSNSNQTDNSDDNLLVNNDKWIEDINGFFPSPLCANKDIYKFPYYSWYPSTITSKQPHQILTRYGWQNASSNYAPLEALLCQSTLKILRRLESELQENPTQFMYVVPPLNDTAPSFEWIYPRHFHPFVNVDVAFISQSVKSITDKLDSLLNNSRLIDSIYECEPKIEHYQALYLNCISLYHNRTYVKNDDISLEQIDSVLTDSDSNENENSGLNSINSEKLQVSQTKKNLSVEKKKIDQKCHPFRMKYPRACALKFGLVFGVPWWKDEGSIGPLTWEFFLRFCLWESLCDIKPETLKYGRFIYEGNTTKKKKKKKNLSQNSNLQIDSKVNVDNCVLSDNSLRLTSLTDNSKHCSSLEYSELDDVNLAIQPDLDDFQSDFEHSQVQLVSSHANKDGEFSKLACNQKLSNDNINDQNSTQENNPSCEEDYSDLNERSWIWLIDLKKASSFGIKSMEELTLMESIMKKLLGVISTNESSESFSTNKSGWNQALSPDERCFLISWICNQILQTTMGRDMIDKQLEIHNSARYLLLQKDKTRMQNQFQDKAKSDIVTNNIDGINVPNKTPDDSRSISNEVNEMKSQNENNNNIVESSNQDESLNQCEYLDKTSAMPADILDIEFNNSVKDEIVQVSQPVNNLSTMVNNDTNHIDQYQPDIVLKSDIVEEKTKMSEFETDSTHIELNSSQLESNDIKMKLIVNEKDSTDIQIKDSDCKTNITESLEMKSSNNINQDKSFFFNSPSSNFLLYESNEDTNMYTSLKSAENDSSPLKLHLNESESETDINNSIYRNENIDGHTDSSLYFNLISEPSIGLGKESIFVGLDILNHKFKSRKECLGEDRYLNRYFLSLEVPSKKDLLSFKQSSFEIRCSLLIEYHILVPLPVNVSIPKNIYQLNVSLLKLSPGVATYNDLNSCYLTMSSSKPAQKNVKSTNQCETSNNANKLLNIRGRPRKRNSHFSDLTPEDQKKINSSITNLPIDDSQNDFIEQENESNNDNIISSDMSLKCLTLSNIPSIVSVDDVLSNSKSNTDLSGTQVNADVKSDSYLNEKSDSYDKIKGDLSVSDHNHSISNESGNITSNETNLTSFPECSNSNESNVCINKMVPECNVSSISMNQKVKIQWTESNEYITSSINEQSCNLINSSITENQNVTKEEYSTLITLKNKEIPLLDNFDNCTGQLNSIIKSHLESSVNVDFNVESSHMDDSDNFHVGSVLKDTHDTFLSPPNTSNTTVDRCGMYGNIKNIDENQSKSDSNSLLFDSEKISSFPVIPDNFNNLTLETHVAMAKQKDDTSSLDLNNESSLSNNSNQDLKASCDYIMTQTQDNSLSQDLSYVKSSSETYESQPDSRNGSVEVRRSERIAKVKRGDKLSSHTSSNLLTENLQMSIDKPISRINDLMKGKFSLKKNQDRFIFATYLEPPRRKNDSAFFFRRPLVNPTFYVIKPLSLMNYDILTSNEMYTNQKLSTQNEEFTMQSDELNTQNEELNIQNEDTQLLDLVTSRKSNQSQHNNLVDPPTKHFLKMNLEGCQAYIVPNKASFSLKDNLNSTEESVECLDIFIGDFVPLPFQIPNRKKKKANNDVEKNESVDTTTGDNSISSLSQKYCKYIPVIQWGKVVSKSWIEQLTQNLSHFTLRERSLKYKLSDLLKKGVFRESGSILSSLNVSTPNTQQYINHNSHLQTILSTDETFTSKKEQTKMDELSKEVYSRVFRLIQSILIFKADILDKVLCQGRHADLTRFNYLCLMVKIHLTAVKNISSVIDFVHSCIFLVRSAVFLILCSMKLVKSIPYLSKSSSFSSFGWNSRSSPYQWEAELKAIDWIFHQVLPIPNEKSNSLEFIKSQSVFYSNPSQYENTNLPKLTYSIWNEINAKYFCKNYQYDQCKTKPNTSSDLMTEEAFTNANTSICDFICLIGLYLTLWSRFGLNRQIVEHLISTSLEIKCKQQLNDTLLFLKKINNYDDAFVPLPLTRINFYQSNYHNQIQFLKTNGVTAIDEWLPSSVEAHDTFEVLTTWVHFNPVSLSASTSNSRVTPPKDTASLSTDKTKTVIKRKEDNITEDVVNNSNTTTPTSSLYNCVAQSFSNLANEFFEPYMRLRCRKVNSDHLKRSGDTSNEHNDFFLYLPIKNIEPACITGDESLN